MTKQKKLLKILSTSDATGWYRIRGTRHTHEIEKIAVWAVICQGIAGKNRNHVVVGMLPDDIGRKGYDYNYFIDDVAGYVHHDELVDGFVNAAAFKRLKWPEELLREKAAKAKQKKTNAEKSARKAERKAAKKAMRKNTKKIEKTETNPTITTNRAEKGTLEPVSTPQSSPEVVRIVASK